jgi:hypothetical protein
LFARFLDTSLRGHDGERAGIDEKRVGVMKRAQIRRNKRCFYLLYKNNKVYASYVSLDKIDSAEQT